MRILEFWPALIEGVWLTLLITMLSFTFGSILAIFITIARRSRFLVFRFLGTAYVEVFRGIPPLPWLFLVYFAFPAVGITLDAVPTGIAVFTIISAAYITEIYRSGLRAVAMGQFEASDSLGLSRFNTYYWVIVPQAIRTIFPMAIAYLIGLVKDSALVSMIGVQDITSIAVAESRTSGESMIVFLSAAALYMLISVPIGVFGRSVEKRLVSRLKQAPQVVSA
ncbi:MAG: hypothetical protein RIS09_561 [Actinomycetota bacterium]|jgi:polar amino acid transport system permease protein